MLGRAKALRMLKEVRGTKSLGTAVPDLVFFSCQNHKITSVPSKQPLDLS